MRKVFGKMSKTYKIQRLQAKHKAIIEYVLQGLGRKEIAAIFEKTPEGIGLIISSPVFQEELSRRREQLVEKTDEVTLTEQRSAMMNLQENQFKASQVQIDLLGSEDERIKQTSAMDILDRTGIPKVRQTDNRNANITLALSVDDLERIGNVTRTVFNKNLEVPAS